jgi:hypothetical protein
MIKEDVKRKLVSGSKIQITSSHLIFIEFYEDFGCGMWSYLDGAVAQYSQATHLRFIISDEVNLTNIDIDLRTQTIKLDDNSYLNGWFNLPRIVKEKTELYCSWLMSNEGHQYCLNLEDKIKFYA